MSEDVIPSWMRVREVGGQGPAFGGAFDNTALRHGEVIRVIYPDDRSSRTKKFVEYDVLVQHRENGTAVTKLYHNCLVANFLAGFADKAVFTLRVNDRPQGTETSTGSQVLVQCLDGATASALIVGGIRNSSDSDKAAKAKKHHAEFEFNGVSLQINDDGSWTIENKGKTAGDGTAHAQRNAGAGTKMRVLANGNWIVETPGAAQAITIDHSAGTVTVNSASHLKLLGDRVSIGSAATEPTVLGLQLVQVLTTLITILASETHDTFAGPTKGNLSAPQLLPLIAQLQLILSQHSFVQRSGH